MAAVRLGLNLVDHRARLPPREKQPQEVRS